MPRGRKSVWTHCVVLMKTVTLSNRNMCTRSELHENAAPLQVILQYCLIAPGGSVLPAALRRLPAGSVARPRPRPAIGNCALQAPSAALGDPGSSSQFGFAPPTPRSSSPLTAGSLVGKAALGRGGRWPCDPTGSRDVEGQVSVAEGGVHVGARGVLSASSNAKQPLGGCTHCQGT